PFSLRDIKAAIPPECFSPIVWKSMTYFFVDVLAIVGLYVAATLIDSWFFWPAFWLLGGTMFWALFVVGHDCGHGSFSRNRWINGIVGHLAHTPLLVPYHAWRISHRLHHSVTGHLEEEEAWYPLTESEYRAAPLYIRIMRFTPLLLILFPFYLMRRHPRKDGSHFLPWSRLFRQSERRDAWISSFWCFAMLGALGYLTYEFGFLFLLKYYLGPYIVFVSWLDLVTYLHHTAPEIPWYRGNDWNFLRGALSTIDRDYGFINEIHHNIGTHVVHHLFIGIPHYHLNRATEAIRPVLGEYYRRSSEPIWSAFNRSRKSCAYVSDEGGVVHYQS
ncbi:MAG: fatty acid desaturase, partial [Leptospiraceae bacterium]|nr:fatty acid desaturase [Leptospiraceae bacterium]